MLFFQSILELPVMFLFSWMLKKAGSRTWCGCRASAFSLHALGAWVAPNMGAMYAVQIFEMNGYALFTLSSIYFVNETVDERQRVQGQAWFTMCTTLGSVLASFVGASCWISPARPFCWPSPPPAAGRGWPCCGCCCGRAPKPCFRWNHPADFEKAPGQGLYFPKETYIMKPDK